MSIYKDTNLRGVRDGFSHRFFKLNFSTFSLPFVFTFLLCTRCGRDVYNNALVPPTPLVLLTGYATLFCPDALSNAATRLCSWRTSLRFTGPLLKRDDEAAMGLTAHSSSVHVDPSSKSGVQRQEDNKETTPDEKISSFR